MPDVTSNDDAEKPEDNKVEDEAKASASKEASAKAEPSQLQNQSNQSIDNAAVQMPENQDTANPEKENEIAENHEKNAREEKGVGLSESERNEGHIGEQKSKQQSAKTPNSDLDLKNDVQRKRKLGQSNEDR